MKWKTIEVLKVLHNSDNGTKSLNITFSTPMSQHTLILLSMVQFQLRMAEDIKY